VEYIVLRNWPAEFADQEGCCFAFRAKPETFNVPDYFHGTVIVFRPTGHFETREGYESSEDCSQAEVYERRGAGENH
jgi:hypothetical protein